MHLAPVAPSRRLVVRALHRDVRCLADCQCFRDRCFEIVTFIAHVRHVTRSAGRARRFGAGDQLAAVGVTTRLVDQPARHAERTLVDRIANEPRLRAHLVGLERARRVAGDAAARRSQADQ